MAQAISNTTQKKKYGISGAFDPRIQIKPAGSAVSGAFARPAPVKQGATLSASSLSSPGLAYQTPKPTAQVSAPTRSAVAPVSAPTGTSSGLVTSPQPTKSSATATRSVQPEAPKRGLLSYPGLIGDIAGASKPNDTQRQILQALMSTGANNSAIAEEARRLSEEYGKEISEVGRLGAGAVAGDLSTGTNIVGSGNAAIASQSASARMSALAQGQQAALEGTGQQLTAQQQMANAQAQALGGANTQQATQLGGLGTAAGFAQPQVAGFGQTVFDPTTGTFGGGSGNLDPQNVASQLAQKVIAGQMTYEQAVASLGYAGGAGQQFLNGALQQMSPGFNAPLASAQVGGQQSVLGQLPQLQSADIAAEGIKNKVITYLASNPQLNPSDLAVGNTLQQWIQGKQLTDPKYQTLFNYLNEYTNTLAPILGVGGDPTNLKTQIAQSFINAAASGQSIATVLDNMQSLSRGKIQDIQSGALGGGVVSSPTTGTGTGSGGVFDW